MKLIKYSSIFVGIITILVNPLCAQTYHAYVAAESDDQVYQIAFNAETEEGSVSDIIPVGQYPTETEGPHGINVGLKGEYWYLSIAHGTPYGWLYKFETGSNKFIDRTELGMFPASLETSKATGLLYVVNFNLHGDMEPSTVSVVDPEAMSVIKNIKTGIMPHGSRITGNGKFQYHVSMMTDELMEINTTNMKLSRRLSLSQKDDNLPRVKPTWADPHPQKNLVYVAGNGSDEIIEVDTDNWKILRRFEAGKAPYNLEVSNNGKHLVASYKGEAATGIWDLESGEEVAKVANSRKVTHGVSITPDSKYAFISVEGIGGQAGSVDVINLNTQERADVIEVGKQAGGIIYWKTTSK
ncbi:YncE family protein [Fodinibius halophilus]|uniref:YncE family protein n=1 Tax=Fodinibius halophilus TaxID=1736908 RepID=A0A6M1TN17_9BACT|nr:YncE family protein [Fodinibius halophilus]NGP89740.1 YncE family protein [Fodinibius halophilus]